MKRNANIIEIKKIKPLKSNNFSEENNQTSEKNFLKASKNGQNRKSQKNNQTSDKITHIPTFLDCRKKGPYVNMSQTKIRNVCLPVISEFCLLLLVIVCSASAALLSLCRGLKYLLKVRYAILVYTNVDGFLFQDLNLCPWG